VKRRHEPEGVARRVGDVEGLTAAAGDGEAERTVVEGLRRAAAMFGTPTNRSPRLQWLALLGVPRCAGNPRANGRANDLPLAIELVYEGYLLHYRQSRTLARGLPFETRLLAGDYFYAHGLRLVAHTGDVGAVALLTRLMAACSFLRAQRARLEVDDSLWELTVAAVGAGDGPCRTAAAGAYEHFDQLAAAARADELPTAVEAGARAVLACAARKD
jgi:hypothetical protein